jgi:hypothetical protein
MSHITTKISGQYISGASIASILQVRMAAMMMLLMEKGLRSAEVKWPIIA